MFDPFGVAPERIKFFYKYVIPSGFAELKARFIDDSR